MSAVEYYVVTMAIYAALNGIQALGLNMQFGLAGIFNFAYIVLVAVGAYATGVAALGPAPGGLTNYLGGFGWAFPWNLLFGIVVTVAFALLLSLICFSRIAHWYLALTLSSIGYALLVLISNERRIFNGIIGLSAIPGPGQDQFSESTYQLVFLGISVAALVLVYALFTLVERSPLGRAMRALRDDDLAGRSLGKDPFRIKMIAFLLGAAAAGLGGGLMALYVGGWNTSGWLSGETFILLAAIVVGGRGWSRGAFVGSIIVLEGLNQGSQFLPDVGNRPDIAPAIQAIVVSMLLLAVLWWRPYGLWPAPKERFPAAPAEVDLGTAPAVSSAALTGSNL
ncbi:MAG TPA: branched-chain amino acid ABC transporter permease [Chloroflexota bacterium]|nr:branched-chain amino acid ABC transporter permease [Chloroflexota bacterium]